MTEERWVRHSWDLTSLAGPFRVPEEYQLRSGRSDELAEIFGVTAAAFASDPGWGLNLGRILGRLEERIRSTLGRSGFDYLLATAEREVVAVSGLAKAHGSDQNFLTGVCIHPRHQRRGLGTQMLSQSLSRLRAMGLVSACVYTKEGTVADRYLYTRFDSTRRVGVSYPPRHQAVGPAPLMRGWVRFS